MDPSRIGDPGRYRGRPRLVALQDASEAPGLVARSKPAFTQEAMMILDIAHRRGHRCNSGVTRSCPSLSRERLLGDAVGTPGG